MKYSWQKFVDYFLIGILGILPIVIILQIVVYIERLLRDFLLRIYGRYSNLTVPIVIGPAEKALLWALYDGEVQDVDRLVGQVWDQIVAQGLADRTLLVITADHGDEFADHGDD